MGRIRSALTRKTTATSLWQCFFGQWVFIHHHDGDAWERCCVKGSSKPTAQCEVLFQKPWPVMPEEKPPPRPPKSKFEMIKAKAALVLKKAEKLALAAMSMFG